LQVFPSEDKPDAQRWLPAAVALRSLRSQIGLPVSRSAFYRWLQNGVIPTRRIVYRYYVAADDVTHFAKESFNP